MASPCPDGRSAAGVLPRHQPLVAEWPPGQGSPQPSNAQGSARRPGSAANSREGSKVDEIPEAVLEVLEVVRSGGETNMMARDAVILLADEIEYLTDGTAETGMEAVAWLIANKPRYMEALNTMGARRTRS